MVFSRKIKSKILIFFVFGLLYSSGCFAETRNLAVDYEPLKEVKIQYQHTDWNEFDFYFTTNLEDDFSDSLSFIWFFGDGKERVSNGKHRYQGVGDFFVTLQVKGEFDNYFYDHVKVSVSFWHWKNVWLWVAIVVGFFGLVVGYLSIKWKKKSA